MRRILSIIVPVVFLGAACSGSSPSSPSPTPSFPNASTGATIAGSIGGASSGGSGSTAGIRPDDGPATGIVVTIVGTTISATVDGSGRFLLTNVPGGTITLQFAGQGITGTLTISDVVGGQTIELSLQLSGSTIALEGERRSSGSGGEEQVEGRIESLPPTTAAGTFVVSGRTVATDLNTRILMGSQPKTFADLQIGQRVHVKGQTGADSVLAGLVDIQNTDTSLGVNVNGTVQSINPASTATLFDFMVGDRQVRGDGTTEFFGGSAFADLVADARVEVKGQQGDGFVQALRIHVNKPDDDDDDDDAETEFTGTLMSIGGSSPTLTLLIGTTTVMTTGATEVRRRGDNLTFAALQVGQTIDVSGTTQPGGSVLAKKLTIESEDQDVDVESAVTGSATGLCPAIQFTIGSVTFSTTSFTEFKKTSCSAVLAGVNLRLKVRGVMTGPATAQATRVEIKD